MKKTTTFLLSGAIVFGMTACSEKIYEPIVDGRSTPEYQRDLAECRNLSLQRQKDDSIGNQGAISGAVAGGLIGLLDGGSVGDVVGGAAIGGAFGKISGDSEAEETLEGQRNQIVFNCLRGRGHKVVG